MIWLLLTTAIISFADLPPGTALPAPDNIKAITIENRDEVLYGSVEEQPNQIKITYDTPWHPQPVQSMSSLGVTWEDEPPRKREQRLLEEGRKAGYTRVTTAQGEQWLPIKEVELAERAREMAAGASVESPAAEPAPGVAAAVEETVPAAPPSPYRRYAVQGIIAVAGLVAAGLILRFMVFAE